jgi:hypothetical protein
MAYTTYTSMNQIQEIKEEIKALQIRIALLAERGAKTAFPWKCIKCKGFFRGKENRHDSSLGYVCLGCWQAAKVKMFEEMTRK